MMTCYQGCHRHLGHLTRETAIARKLLERHGRPCPKTVKELRNETDMPMAECADMLRCMWRDMELERLQVENDKLRELVGMMSKAIGVTVDNCHGDCIGPYECTLYGGCPIQRLMRELRIEVE